MLRLAAVLVTTLVVRPSFAAPDFLDPTFGSGGIVHVSSEIIDTVAQPDGKVLTVPRAVGRALSLSGQHVPSQHRREIVLTR